MSLSCSNKDKVEMGMFVTRFCCSLLIFVLGLKAPGIMAPYNPHQRLDDSSNDSNGSVPTGSAFRNGWRKLRTLFPYLWPKKDRMLQLAVLVCITLLAAGRVIKLFLPIYRKLLGRSCSQLTKMASVIDSLFFLSLQLTAWPSSPLSFAGTLCLFMLLYRSCRAAALAAWVCSTICELSCGSACSSTPRGRLRLICSGICINYRWDGICSGRRERCCASWIAAQTQLTIYSTTLYSP